MQILYMATNGAADPTKASIPWHLAANGSAEAGQSAVIVLAGDATELLRESTRSTIEGVGLPPLRELMGKARDKELPVYV